MERSPSALQDARNLGVGELEASSPKTSSTLKAVYQKVMCSFRKSRRKQSGMTCLPPIEEDRGASVIVIEEDRGASVIAIEEDRGASVIAIEEDRGASVIAIEEDRGASVIAIEEDRGASVIAIEEDRRASVIAIEQDRRASVIAIEEDHRATVDEMSVHHVVESTVDDVPAAHNTSSSGLGLSPPTSVRVDKCSPPPSSSSLLSSSTVYSSPCIERMMQTRSDFSTDLEFEIESSKDHWSEVTPLSDDSELVSQDPQAFIEQGIFAGMVFTERGLAAVRDVCNVSLDHITRDEELMWILEARWLSRFGRSYITHRWDVGSKIGEGAQAEIFEANPKQVCTQCHGQGRICRYVGIPRDKYVVKVFREGYRLRDLQRLWPKQVATGYSALYTCPIRCGYLLPNGRFAFLMPRYWGDLRKFLDERMQQRLDCTRPPCSDWKATRSMLYIAKGMRDLHISNIVHRDLKASNVLVEMIERSESQMEEIGNKEVDTFYCRVADFESSKGVLGTGFWRAPEILVAVKDRCVTLDLFTKASDVYSYAMTCYEIWTGCLPFENLKNNEYDIILGGERPILPGGLKPWIREMLERCWHADPCERPTFQDICDTITNNSQDASVKCMDDIEEKEFEKRMTFGAIDTGEFEGILEILEVSD